MTVSGQNENIDCEVSEVFEDICCKADCSIKELYVKEIECITDTTYNFILGFDAYDYDSDTFDVYVNGYKYGSFSLDQLPLEVQNIDITNSETGFVKVCMDNLECCKGLEFKTPDCNVEECALYDGTYKVYFDTIDNSYIISINFLHENNSSIFNIKGNGRNYGNFFYENLPVNLGPFDCDEGINHEFVIADNEIDDCKLVILPGKINCPEPDGIENLLNIENWNIQYYNSEKTVNIYSNSNVTLNSKIEIFDQLGRKVIRQELQDGRDNIIIPISSLNQGMYIVRFINNNVGQNYKVVVY